MKPKTGAEIRQSFIDFFKERGHTFVASSSVVPGGDQTLLFTNAGMVQFKDVFLGTDHRPYTRAVNSQKCLRVAGKHNDLDDVGRDNSHHTFFEMLGNWSFGDYYKKDAIAWAWELLTSVWELDRSKLWVTVFKDEKGSIPTDEEAAAEWRKQPGLDPSHILYFGRKDNFWEMAETGPCGPDSEIHIDLGEDACDKKGIPGHVCGVNGDCKRFLELWNLVFIQYNRINSEKLEPLPATHVDTGMGLDRIVSIMQNTGSNYKTDLFFPLLKVVQQLTGHTDGEREKNLTPYRVIADHARSAAFLIADGVVPGNTGRNYVCRMIIRRAARFGSKIGLNEPFLAKVAEVVVDNYSVAYPELAKNRKAILDSLTREEKRFQRTVEEGINHLEDMLRELDKTGSKILNGERAFDLYATHGVPLEITRDICREQGYEVDESGFRNAMDEHRLQSGAGKAFGLMGGEDVEVFRTVFEELQAQKKIPASGVSYDPYKVGEFSGEVLALFYDGEVEQQAEEGQLVEVLLPHSGFYIESGGQTNDTGVIRAQDGSWEIEVEDLRKPAAGLIVHIGTVKRGRPAVGDKFTASVDYARRKDIMRNHTATHLLHAQLHSILGDHARQAGSLVAPDRLRFDFTHPEAVTPKQLERIEEGVNRAILDNFKLTLTIKSLNEAISEGAMALFGEKYGETVRTITIGDKERVSYELCGGTHVDETGDIGLFLITSESSAAAGVRRIEAVTGRGAYELVQKRTQILRETAFRLSSSVDGLPEKAITVLDETDQLRKQLSKLRQELVAVEFQHHLENAPVVNGVPVLAVVLANADADTLRQMSDKFRERYPSGIIVLGSVADNKPMLISAVTEDLIKRGISAGELVKSIAPLIGGSGGGRPNLAQAGGKDPTQLPAAIAAVAEYVKDHLK
ncbi:MAG TPA: alanine--tRNA ligase [Longilinea sp.]|nr:alanine--tRNA ligase [Longilinea sp.]